MRHWKIRAMVLAFVLCLALVVPALGEDEGALAALWDSGCDLLFRTDNVMVQGQAAFFLEGERFKTAELHYVQDGCRSYYRLKLLTPREGKKDQETGWTIIANQEGDYAVMEDYTPGVYRMGTDTPQNTLLRRSVQLDALAELGGLLTRQIAPMLPAGTVSTWEDAGNKTVHIALSEGQIPEVAVSALNIAAGFLGDRWFSNGHDRSYALDERAPFDHYITVAQALVDGTVRWTLRKMDADFALNAQGRLNRASGSVQVVSTYWDGVRRTVTVQFDLEMTDYGKSHVAPFDPEAYGVVTPWELTKKKAETEVREAEMSPEDWDAWLNRAKNLLEAQGHPVRDLDNWGGWITEKNHIWIEIVVGGAEEYLCVFAEDGSLLKMQHLPLDYEAVEEPAEAPDDAVIAAVDELIRAFMADAHPALAESLDQLEPQELLRAADGSEYLFVRGADGHPPRFIVRLTPSLRLESYDNE